MKSTAEPKTTPAEPEFPRLFQRISIGDIVLFSNPSKGTVIYSGPRSGFVVGYQDDNWAPPCTNTTYWKPFHGKVILES